jgi:hypothetical protein
MLPQIYLEKYSRHVVSNFVVMRERYIGHDFKTGKIKIESSSQNMIRNFSQCLHISGWDYKGRYILPVTICANSSEKREVILLWMRHYNFQYRFIYIIHKKVSLSVSTSACVPVVYKWYQWMTITIIERTIKHVLALSLDILWHREGIAMPFFLKRTKKRASIAALHTVILV